jgi:hypothetical protein
MGAIYLSLPASPRWALSITVSGVKVEGNL